MKLRTPASPPPATLAFGLALAAALALLPWAAVHNSDEPPPLGAQSAFASEPAGEDPPPQLEGTQTQGICVAESSVGLNAPSVSIITSAAELGFLLSDDERAALAADPTLTATIKLAITPMNVKYPGVNQPANPAATSASAPSSTPATTLATVPATFTATASGVTPAAAPGGSQLSIEFLDYLVLLSAAEDLYNFPNESGLHIGSFPFDLVLTVQLGSGEPRVVTGPLGGELQLSLEFTDQLVDAIKEQGVMGDEFTFAVFHGRSGGQGLQPERCGGLGTQDQRTLVFSLSSLSPFIIAWSEDEPIPPSTSAPPSTGTTPPGTGTTTPTAPPSAGTTTPSAPPPSATPGTTTPEPTTPQPSVPEPDPDPAPPADDPAAADEPQAPAAPEPFLAWSPKQGARSITLRWTQVEGADGYLIYKCRCNSGGVKRTPKLAVALPAGTGRYAFRSLRKGCWYKHRVEAYRLEGGQRVTLAASPLVHASTLGGKSRVASGVQITSVRDASGAALALHEPESPAGIDAASSASSASSATAASNNTTAGSITTASNLQVLELTAGSTATASNLQVLELTAGQRVQLSARETGRKLIVHHRGMRFASSNSGVASITNSGRLVAHAEGSCLVWAYVQSGVFHMIELRITPHAA